MCELKSTDHEKLEKLAPGATEHCEKLNWDVSEICFEYAIDGLNRCYTVRRWCRQGSIGEGEADIDQKDGLPLIERAPEALANQKPSPPELVAGLLHKGSKLILGGGSKAFKSWALLDLAVSVASGVPFWGLETIQGRVLYVNLEIQETFFSKRVDAICQALGVAHPAFLDIWNLRGYADSAEALLPKIIERVKSLEYAIIIIDPFYKIMGGADENSAGPVAGLLNELEKLAVQTGAAVVFGAHFAKGNSSSKEAIDRVSGSGSFARDPDSIVMMTPHEVEGAFTVDTILRNFPPMEPFVVRRDHPLMVRDEELDPGRLKAKPGGRKARTVEEILELLPLEGEGLITTQWQKLAKDELGISNGTFYVLLKKAKPYFIKTCNGGHIRANVE